MLQHRPRLPDFRATTLALIAFLGIHAQPSFAAPKKPAAATKLVIRPGMVHLEGAGAEQTLLVEALGKNGAAADVSRAAKFRSSNLKVISVTASGVVRAVGDGTAIVEARSGTGTTRVPVRVRNAKVQRPVSFVRDVVPLLTRSGCYAAACHSKQGGKGGFQLSVLAFDPEADYAAISRQSDSRRLNRQEPAASLLLRKATLSIPHAGGQRFKVDSAEYRLLTRWVSEGATYRLEGEADLARVEVEPAERVMTPGKSQQLLVTAVYGDGSRVDVTRQAQYRSDEISIADVNDSGLVTATKLVGETAVMARYLGKVAVARVSLPLPTAIAPKTYAGLPRFNLVDEPIYRKLSRLNMLPSALCDDATFLRRASLDLIGTLPTAEETKAFLKECEAESPGPGKPSLKARTSLVSRLLERTDYADYWAMRWSNLLLVNPDLLLPRGAYAFDRWLRESFQANMPFDQFAREIVTASGETYRDGPPNFFRALPKPEDAAKSVGQLFLGVRLECAQCHHHPFERWGQDDFYSLAAYFARVKEKSSYPEGYMSVIYNASSGEVKHPKTGEVMPPRPLGGAAPVIAEGMDRREALAAWMTSPENPFFAKAIVNRVWGLLMGRGMVEPVDDFRVTNPSLNEPLLEALAKDFIEHTYDLKHLLRTITASAAYQRSSAGIPANASDTRNYARYYKKRLPAEVLLDALGQVTGIRETFRGHPEGTRAIQMWDSRLDVEFLDTFGRPVRQSVCECERPSDSSVPQMLHLMNSQRMQERLSDDKGTAALLDKSGKNEEELVQELYLTTLNRLPTAAELQTAKSAFMREKVTRRQAIEDVLWALLNSAEFILNH